MKNILLSTAALAGLAFVAAPALADEPALQLGLGGYVSGYAVYTDQDEPTNTEFRKFDFRKDTEVQLNGEVALDNGITAGAHMELLADRSDTSSVEESYMYLSSSWGRVNFGEEDGIAYLIQVAPPTADDKVDGARPDIGTFGLDVGGTLAYAQDPFGYTNKLTYITPVFNGFQTGFSYTPTVGVVNTPTLSAIGFAGITGSNLSGITASQTNNDADQFENGWELAARYEGSLNAVDFALGAGYSAASLENKAASTFFDDDFNEWNAAATAGFGAFDLGAAYLETNNGLDGNFQLGAWVLGADYKIGAYKLGLNYVDATQENGTAGDIDIERWTAGTVYEWGPGMTFRGAVQYQTADNGASDADGTQVTLGTQLNF